MVSKKIALITAAILSCPIHSMAQQKETNTSMVEHKAGVVTYYPAKMGFSPNDNLGAVFNSITRYSNIGSYTLMVNGEDYLQNNDAFYSRTLVADIERIEIITDQSLMGANVGTNGYINVVLREREEGTHGQVGFEMDTKKNHTPIASISHKKDKWTVWGSFVGDINRGKSESKDDRNTNRIYSYNTISSRNEEELTTIKETYNSKSRFKNFHIGTNYNDDKNNITLELNGKWDSRQTEQTRSYDDIINRHDIYDDYHYLGNTSYSDTTTSHSIDGGYYKTHTYNASINWRHKVNEKLSFRVHASEEIYKQPSEDTYTIESYEATWTGNTPSSIAGYTQPYYSSGNTKAYNTKLGILTDYKPTNELGIKGGVLGYVNNIKTHSESLRQTIPYNSKGQTTRIMPYVLAQYSVGQFLFSVGERFSFYNTKFTHNDTIDIPRIVINPAPEQSDELTVKNSYNESVTNAGVAWTPFNGHRLIASYMHQNYKSYLYRDSYNYSDGTTKMDSYPVDIKYDIFDFGYSYTSKHINVGINAKYMKDDTDREDHLLIESILPYATYRTRGHKRDIYDISASATYSHKIFCIAGDLDFHKEENETRYTYRSPLQEGEETRTTNSSTGNIWTLRLTPMVRLPYDINVSATVAFQSIKKKRIKLYGEEERVTDKWLTLRATKSWKNFDIYMRWENALYKNDDYTSSTFETTPSGSRQTFSTSYENKHQSSVTFGGCWRF